MQKHTLPTAPGASTGALPIHPRTGLTAVGIVGGKPVWPIMGGSAPAGEPPPTPAPPVPQPAPQPQAPTKASQPNKGDQPQDVSSLPEWAQKLITDTRAEAAKHRTDKQTAAQQAQAAEQQRNAILKALGYTADGKQAPPDPETLAKQVDDYKAVAWENAVQAGILRVSTGLGVDADALLDSNSFLDSLEEFVDDDPTSKEFRDKLTKHVKGFVDKHPKFKTAPAGPARSGGDHPGGGTAPTTTRPTSLMAAVQKSLGG